MNYATSVPVPPTPDQARARPALPPEPAALFFVGSSTKARQVRVRRL